MLDENDQDEPKFVNDFLSLMRTKLGQFLHERREMLAEQQQQDSEVLSPASLTGSCTSSSDSINSEPEASQVKRAKLENHSGVIKVPTSNRFNALDNQQEDMETCNQLRA